MTADDALERQLDRAAEAIASADAILIGAGAGMGVDSGLPDFRGDAGFWTAYPPFRGRSFSSLSTPHWFRTDPELAWGFFGHRLNLYRGTAPHDGFQILKSWMSRPPLGAFVFTSNVDGQFQRSGFPEERLFECHGSIHWLQCAKPCCVETWSAHGVQIDVDPETIRSRTASPLCPRCGGIARPNVLMFNDGTWLEKRQLEQYQRYRDWLRTVQGTRVVAIEIGAGLAIPTVRIECEDVATTLIRINPRECETDPHGIALPLGALESLARIARRIAPSA